MKYTRMIAICDEGGSIKSYEKWVSNHDITNDRVNNTLGHNYWRTVALHLWPYTKYTVFNVDIDMYVEE